MEPSKAVPLNASKQDGPLPKPHSVSLNDTETRKLMEECKRLQGEMMKLSEENRHLRVSFLGPESKFSCLKMSSWNEGTKNVLVSFSSLCMFIFNLVANYFLFNSFDCSYYLKIISLRLKKRSF